MNRVVIIGIVATAVAGFTGCQKEEAVSGQGTGVLIKESFSATFDRNRTKTSTPDGGTTVNWAANDIVYYYTADAGVTRNFTIASAGPNASLSLEREAGDTYFNLVYTGNVAPAFTVKKSSSIVFDGVRTSQDGTFTNANVSVARAVPGGSSVIFKPVTALVKFTTDRTDIKTIILTGGAGTENVAGNISVDPTASAPTASLSGTGSTGITVTIASPAAGTYYINLLPVPYVNGLKFTLKDASGAMIGTVTASKSIDLSAENNMLNLGNIDSHIVAPATDLSSCGTANCYIVPAAGTYKFKAVQGNSSTSVGAVASCDVLWESFGTSTAPAAGDLVKADVFYADSYISFTTGSLFPSKKGNAVIAARDSEGNILWSWHIWLASNPTDQVYNNSAGTMMDRNLGATSVNKGDVGALGLLYQWGRKDPFLNGDGISSNTVAASTLSWPTPATSNADNGTISYAVSHPTTFINGNYSNSDWYYTGSESTDNTRWGHTKTIYDPCPAGYRVPDGGEDGIWEKAFGVSDISDGPWDSTNCGMNFGSGNGQSSTHQLGTSSYIWYPASGALVYFSGALVAVGTNGFAWSVDHRTTIQKHYAYHLSFNNEGQVLPENYFCGAEGHSVRCAKESDD